MDAVEDESVIVATAEKVQALCAIPMRPVT